MRVVNPDVAFTGLFDLIHSDIRTFKRGVEAGRIFRANDNADAGPDAGCFIFANINWLTDGLQKALRQQRGGFLVTVQRDGIDYLNETIVP